MECHIRELRKKAGLTQKELAKLMDTNESLISRWETFEHFPSLPLAFKLAKVLNCTVDNLYTFE